MASKVCIFVSITLGVVLVVLGVCLKWAIFPAVVTAMINSQLKLTPDNAETWEAWIEPPVTPYMKFTFFNVENAEDFRNGYTPRVTEIGPFSYEEDREKMNPVTIYDEISYGSYIGYSYHAETSCADCSIDTNVTVINPVMILLPYLVDKTLEDIRNMPIGSLRVTNNETIYMLAQTLIGKMTGKLNTMTSAADARFPDDVVLTGTPDDMIFNGVKSPILEATYAYLIEKEGLLTDIGTMLTDILLDVVHDMLDENTISHQIYLMLPKEIQDIINLINTLVASGMIDINQTIIDTLAANLDVAGIIDNLALPPMIDLKAGTFGFFKGTNATQTYWKINSGKYNLDQYQRVLEFNGNSRLPDGWWPNFGPTPNAESSGLTGICHDILGTDGLAFSPGVTENDKLWLFNDQLCRSIWLTYEDDVNIDGIKALKFTPPADVFSFSNPDNFCYCPDIRECAQEANSTWDLSQCERCVDGIISLEGCQGVPVIMSTPHFLDGDERLWKSIDGLQPVRDLHVTYLNLEPLSGMPLQAHKRIQISLPVSASPYFDSLNNLLTNMPNYTQPELVFPLTWVDEGADIDAENLKKAKGLLVTPFIAVDAVTGILIAVGGLTMIGSLLWYLKSKCC